MKTNIARYYFMRITNIFIITLFIGACGVKDPSVINQKSGTVKIPKFKEFNQSLRLDKNNQGELNLIGSMIFWDKDADISLLNKAMNRSVEIKYAEKEYKKLAFQEDDLRISFSKTKLYTKKYIR